MLLLKHFLPNYFWIFLPNFPDELNFQVLQKNNIDIIGSLIRIPQVISIYAH